MKLRMRIACLSGVALLVALAGCFKANINPNVDINGFGGGPSRPGSSAEFMVADHFDDALDVAVAAMRHEGVKNIDVERKEDDDRWEGKVKGSIGDDISVETKVEEQKDARRMKIRIKAKGSASLAADIERRIRRHY